MGRAHVLVLPFPAQGHVNPLMDLSHELAKHDIKITFVNTDFTHRQIMEAEAARCEEDKEQVRSDQIKLVSLPDWMEQEVNRNSLKTSVELMWEVMPKKLEKLIQEINEKSEESEKISCVIADGTMACALEVAEKMGIRRAAFFWPASAAFLALFLSVPKFLHDGIIDSDGTPTKDQIIHLAPEMPAMRTTHFLWLQLCDNLNAQKKIFNYVIRGNKNLESAYWVICNTCLELEAPTLAFAPKTLSIGPLQARKSNHMDHLGASFWPEDSTCLKWLDLQPNKSVIYVAFGSMPKFELTQLQELALGLELSNKPFLWVVRSDINNRTNYDFLKEFEERLCSRGKVVDWSPQQKVLSHPSVACFLSHCGWNSTIEGVINGVPFLCWPLFDDQFIDKTYICDVWKIGIGLDQNDGFISREEIASKIKQVLLDEGFRERALQLKEKAMNSVKEGGSSNKNLNSLVDWIKA